MISASRLLRALSPAIASASPTEALRAGVGATVGLGIAGLFVLSPSIDRQLGLYLIAPFGATSVLLFAVPNSPLAQPWPAIVGNSLAALVGIAACLLVPDPALRVALAVGAAISLTILCRAVHPPAGAVAMTAALNPEAIADLGLWFVLAPVGAGTVLLVAVAALYARLTGRHYPFRQFETGGTPNELDSAPMRRLGLSEDELTVLLERYRQSLNLGVEDLARLIGAAELQAATHRIGPLTAADIMSRSLVTVGPEALASEIVDLFRRHRFTSLPVIEQDGRFLGVIFQMDLISRGQEDALRLGRGFGAAMARLLDRRPHGPARARDLMGVAVPRAAPTTPVAALLPMMAEGEVDAVPILAHGRVVGIVTRTDLIAALARTSLQEAAPG